MNSMETVSNSIIQFQNNYLTLLLGGIAIFMYGMTIASQALEKLMANRISQLFTKVSQNNFLAVVVGISITTLLQSSGAVTAMLVGLGSARVITLPQVMGVIIGTAIGSTVTVQLISFNLTQYALPLFIVFFSIYFLSKKTTIKNICLVMMGFGLLFFGMDLMSKSAMHFTTDPFFKNYISSFRDNPQLSLLISTLFCAFIHSSAVTIGLAMSLAQVGAISLDDAMFWVYGANIGTTSTALIAAVGGNYIARQVAWAHFFYKSFSVGLFLIPPFHNALMNLLHLFETNVYRSVANGHLFFNVLSSIIFFPFLHQGAKLIEKLIPNDNKDEFSTKYLSLNNYQSSALAVSYANRELMRMSDIVLKMIQDSIKLFEHSDPSLIESIRDRDNKVDYLYREIKMFLLDHANNSTTAVPKDIMNMILFISNLERAADFIDINLITLAIKKDALKLEFSHEGWLEIQSMHASVLKVAMTGINAFHNRELCGTAIQLKRDLTKTEIKLRENHISRLNRGLREAINTSSIHLDLLSEYKRIASLICSHAYNNDQEIENNYQDKIKNPLEIRTSASEETKDLENPPEVETKLSEEKKSSLKS